MRRGLATLAALAALACGGAPDETASVRLRFEYREGDTLRYAYRATGAATIPDSTAESGHRTRTYERELTIDEVATEVRPGGEVVLSLVYHLEPDTLKPDMPETIDLQVEITPQGRILDVHGVETARPLYGDIDFQSYFEQSQPVFPERPLEPGDSWTQEVKVVSPRAEPVVTSSTYVLERITTEDGVPVAVIAFHGDIYLPMGARSGDTTRPASEGERTALEERIRVRGRIFFDHRAGVTRRVETTAEATLSRISIEDGAPVRRDLEIREESEMRLLGRGGPSGGR